MIIKARDLAGVVMPLVQVMERSDLSWRDRERIAAAINVCNVQWEDMEKERNVLSRNQGEAQQTSIGGQQGIGVAAGKVISGY